MTTESDNDRIVAEYLSRLKNALSGLPLEQQQLLFASIADHISEARSTLSADSEVAIRDMLDRVGQPEDIAVEASQDQSSPRRRNWVITYRWVTIATALVLALGFVLGSFLTSRSTKPTPSTSTVVAIAVPNFVGEALSTAEAETQTLGLSFEITSTCSTGPSRPGTVLAQSPVAGTSAARGSQVHLTTKSTGCPQ